MTSFNSINPQSAYPLRIKQIKKLQRADRSTPLSINTSQKVPEREGEEEGEVEDEGEGEGEGEGFGEGAGDGCFAMKGYKNIIITEKASPSIEGTVNTLLYP